MSPMVSRPLSIELSLLGFLRAGPLHGYQIHQQLSEATCLGLVWRLKQSRLYSLLEKLEEMGYLESTYETQGGRPPRRIYTLTSRGAEVYREWVCNPVPAPRQMRQEFLAKLYFARQEGNGNPESLLRGQRQVCRSWLKSLNKQADRWQTGVQAWLVYQYRISHVQAILNWLEMCEDTILTKRNQKEISE